MAQKINENSSMILIYNELNDELLLSKYDESYPNHSYRGRVNLPGGAEEKGDNCSLDTLKREISEEFSLENIKNIENYASLKLIKEIRTNILSSAKHYKDFLSIINLENKDPPYYISIDNIFYSFLESRLFDDIKSQLSNGKKIVNEGLLDIVSLENLKRGAPLTAWSTGLVLEDFFNAKIPNPDKNFVVPIKKTLDSYLKSRELFEFK